MERIGKYHVQKVLGRGGMGTVYEAIDPLINRKVAVKTMIAGLGENPELRMRFLREAQAAGGLRHRNIVTVYDLGEDKGQPFIAMEFIEGTDLEKIVQNKEPFSIEWKLDVIRQVCDGLAYAHRSGIVHRDVKPANIRVTPEGEVKIMDFGIAHLQSSTMTKSGLVLGTVHYMAPEQIQGQKLDHRADIFSVGAIAYELIAYRKPFEGESITAVMFKIMHERPDVAALPRTEYSPGLETIIMKAMAREALERYQSLDEMRDDLEEIVRQAAAPKVDRSDPTEALMHDARERRAAGRLDEALQLAREAVQTSPGHAPGLTLVADLEKQEGRSRAARLLEEARRLLSTGKPAEALEHAKKALAEAPTDPAVQALVRQAEGEVLGKRVAHEMAEIRAEMERARAEGQLQKALGLCRRLIELDPDDASVARAAVEIEATIQDREVEQLCGLALAYAADGDVDLALKIAGKIERLAPQNPRYLQLKSYLSEEAGRRAADALTATAQEHLALGNLAEARAAAEEALAAYPSHPTAREIRDRVSSVLASQERGAGETRVLSSATAAAPPLRPPEPPPPPPVPVPIALPKPPSPFAPKPRPPLPPKPAPPAAAPTPAPAAAPPPLVASVAPPVAAAASPPAGRSGARPEPAPAAFPPAAAAPRPTPKPPPAPHEPAPAAGAPPAPKPQPPPAPPRTEPAPAAPRAAAPSVAAPPARKPKPAPASHESPEAASTVDREAVLGAQAPRAPLTPAAPPKAASPTPAAAAAPTGPASLTEALTPLPEGAPANAEAANLVETARRLLRERAPQKALPLLEQAASLEPGHPGIDRLLAQTRIDARKADVESLTTAALNHFVQNNYPRAKKAVEKALALDPENRKAKELMKILGSLG